MESSSLELVVYDYIVSEIEVIGLAQRNVLGCTSVRRNSSVVYHTSISASLGRLVP